MRTLNCNGSPLRLRITRLNVNIHPKTVTDTLITHTTLYLYRDWQLQEKKVSKTEEIVVIENPNIVLP